MLKALSVLTISATLAGCVAVPVDDVYGAPITYVHTAPTVVYVPRPVYIPSLTIHIIHIIVLTFIGAIVKS